MEKDILEKVLTKAVEYYFIGLSAKEAVNKALKEDGRMKVMKEYAMYKGEECLAIGNVYELAKMLNVKVDTIRWYSTPTYKRRLQKKNKKRIENRRVLVELGDEE